MLKPLVSILIPAFNAQEWIADTIRSAVAQTWERKEIVVVDDGSTDRTLTIARQWESDTFRVVTQQNQGAAASRNRAFSLSHGDYIQWLDADDLLAPEKIERQMEILNQCASKRTLVSAAWGKFRYRSHKAKFVRTALWCDLSPSEWLLRRMGQNLYMQTATWLVSRELAEAAGPWDTRLLGDDDNEYFCRILLASDSVRFVPDARVHYRSFGYGSLSYVGLSNVRIDAHWLSMQLHVGYLRSLEDSERVRAACVRYLQTWLPFFYPQRPDIVSMAERMARDLGGQLEVPRSSWKFAWIRATFGPEIAKRVQTTLSGWKHSVEKSWDKALFRMENRRVAANLSRPASTT
ncbi:MAG TPA: glycosyltransferase family 2 protein [Terriglobales bacterium]|jgi:glycosyltransferase involved in cell wall biosynthesis|nr:glycosyltransferase family 2 protein [Terriglobales bacterium]